MGESDAFAGGLIGNIGVNGGYRPPKDLKVLNNMILTPAISGLRADYHYGRVAGLGTKTAEQRQRSLPEQLRPVHHDAGRRRV